MNSRHSRGEANKSLHFLNEPVLYTFTKTTVLVLSEVSNESAVSGVRGLVFRFEGKSARLVFGQNPKYVYLSKRFFNVSTLRLQTQRFGVGDFIEFYRYDNGCFISLHHLSVGRAISCPLLLVLMAFQKCIVNIDHRRSFASVFTQSLSALSFRSPLRNEFRFNTSFRSVDNS